MILKRYLTSSNLSQTEVKRIENERMISFDKKERNEYHKRLAVQKHQEIKLHLGYFENLQMRMNLHKMKLQKKSLMMIREKRTMRKISNLILLKMKMTLLKILTLKMKKKVLSLQHRIIECIEKFHQIYKSKINNLDFKDENQKH